VEPQIYDILQGVQFGMWGSGGRGRASVTDLNCAAPMGGDEDPVVGDEGVWEAAEGYAKEPREAILVFRAANHVHHSLTIPCRAERGNRRLASQGL
jgi:hypothetical protein